MGRFRKLPGAQEWIDEVLEAPERFFLHEDEPFADYVTGVFSSTSTDAHDEMISRKALEELADRLNREPLWMHAHHDVRQPPVGRVLAARVFDRVDEDEAYLVGVCGYFEPQKLLSTDLLHPLPEDQPPEFWELPEGDPPPGQARFRLSRAEVPEALAKRLIDSAPPIVARQPEAAFRKALQPDQVIELAVAAWLLLANPFSKAFLGRLGERAADAVISFYSWLGKEFVQLLQDEALDEAEVLFTTEQEGVRYQFLLPRAEHAELRAPAIRELSQTVRQALLLGSKAKELQPDRITYVYRPSEGWVLEYLVSKRFGVIAREPAEVDLNQFSGFSIAGTAQYGPEDGPKDPPEEEPT